MMRAFLALAFLLSATLPSTAQAQQAWVQIEALPSLNEGVERAQAYAGVFPNVGGFSLTSGWHAIVIGPFSTDEAARQLDVLRGERLIPGDSYLADGSQFRQQFWPVGATPGVQDPGVQDPAIDPAPEPEPLAPVVAPAPLNAPDESPREARTAEALLSDDDRKLVQTAMAWFGHYTAAIDGAFGPGTRSSMAAWQSMMGLEPTGVLTTTQRRLLIETYRADLAALGLQLHRDDKAGIEIQIPAALVKFDRYEAPFAHFTEIDGSGVQVLLISQRGDEQVLFGLYDVMQTLEIVPLDGVRSRGSAAFLLTGQSDKLHSYTQAELENGSIRGFTLVWRPEDALRMEKVLAAMKSSFKPMGERTLDELSGTTATPDDGATLSGLDVRRPALSRSGFYIDAKGTVLTTTEVLGQCDRVTLDGEVEADVTLRDDTLGLAILTPRTALAPAAHAAFLAGSPRQGAEIAVSGYSYEGTLTAPVMTFGQFAEARGLSGETSLSRLTVTTLPGDAGGPVFDTTGAVVGMLLPRRVEAGRVLPDDVDFALGGQTIVSALAQKGLTPAASDRTAAMAAEDLTRLALGMTVLVSCWN